MISREELQPLSSTGTIGATGIKGEDPYKDRRVMAMP